ncbi:signal peptidase II [bacterium]|nr:signal peptidase II [bacterium]
MNPKSLKTFIFYLVSTFVLFEFCESCKNLIIKNLHLLKDDSNPIFEFVFAKNTGAAFSLWLDGAQILGFIGIFMLIVCTIYVYKKLDFQDKGLILSSIMFSSGVIGNTLERFQNGFVIDYIRLKFIDFPVFNLFDMLIVISIILYTALTFFGNKKLKKDEI